MSTKDIKAIMDISAKKGKPGTMVGMKHTDIETLLHGMKSQIAQALPKHLSAERIIQMTTTLISRNPALAECTASSLVGSMMEASILGFKPVSALGQCYFVPYNRNIGTKAKPRWVKEAQFQIGYKGWIDLARRSGQIKNIFAYCVREGDEFTYKLGLFPDLNHVPKSGPDKQMTHVYAVAHYKDGGYDFIVMTRAEVESLRLRNRSQGATPSDAWKTDYEAMAKAKAIKQLQKFMPTSDEIQNATIVDEGIIDLDTAATNDGNGIDLDSISYPEEAGEEFAESEDVTDVNESTDEN